MKVRDKTCCTHLNGLEVVFYCDNCGAMVVKSERPSGEIQVIDSVKAKKALECVEEVARLCKEQREGGSFQPAVGFIEAVVELYGFKK